MPAFPSTVGIQAQARTVGLLYLFIIVAGIFAEGFVRGRLVVYDDAAATARNILAHQTLFRIGFSIEIALLIADTFVTSIFYVLFRPAGKGLSGAAATFRLVSIAVSGAKALLFIAPLILLTGAGLAGLGRETLEGLSLAALRLHGQGYSLSLVFFAVHCILIGVLILRSSFLPRLFGGLWLLAGACYLTNSFVGFLAPSLAGALFPWILLPCLLAEGALCLWLLVRGVNRERWQEQAA